MNEERMINLIVECRVCNSNIIIPVKEEDYRKYLSPNRPNIQDIFPYLTPAERELLISHTCSVCWEKMFSFLEDPEED